MVLASSNKCILASPRPSHQGFGAVEDTNLHFVSSVVAFHHNARKSRMRAWGWVRVGCEEESGERRGKEGDKIERDGDEVLVNVR